MADSGDDPTGFGSPTMARSGIRRADGRGGVGSSSGNLVDSRIGSTASGVRSFSGADSGTHSLAGFQRLELGEELGRGGLGSVLLGRDPILRRELAVKLLLRGDDPTQVASFIEEAQITGQLEHPNIVPVHELGFDPQGRPYMAMKRIEGNTLAEVAAEVDATIRRMLKVIRNRTELETAIRKEEMHLLDIFGKVCDAVAYAHARGVLHRDIKPENVMVGRFGEVLLVDWGLARPIGRPMGLTESSDAPRREAVHVESRGLQKQAARALRGKRGSESDSGDAVIRTDLRSNRANVTLDGEILGTPNYMSPEQAEGESESLDERTDVYALGATLYELLTGSPPFVGDVERVLDQVRDGRLRAPTQRAGVRPVARELEAVILKAMAFQPGDRYRSASDLKEEVDSYKAGDRLDAANYSSMQLFGKWMRRNKTAFTVGLVGVAALVLVVTFFVLSLSNRAVEAERAKLEAISAQETASDAELEARRRARELNSLNSTLVQAQEQIQNALDGAEQLRIEAQEAAERAEEERQRAIEAQDEAVASLIRSRAQLAEQVLRDGATHEAIAYLVGAEGLIPSAIRYGVPPAATVYRSRFREHEDRIEDVALHPNGQWLATASRDERVLIWQIGRHRPRTSIDLDAPATAVAFSPSGNQIAIGLADGRIVTALSNNGFQTGIWSEHNDEIRDLAYQSDDRLASTSRDGTIKLWEATRGQMLVSLDAFINPWGEGGRCLQWLPGGNTLIGGGANWTLVRYDFNGTFDAAPQPTYQLDTGAYPIWDVVSIDENTFATSAGAGGIQIRELASGQVLTTFGVPDNAMLRSLVGSTHQGDDGEGAKRTFLYAGASDGSLTVWDTSATGAPLIRTRFHENEIRGLAIDAEGRRLITGSWDSVAVAWDLLDRDTPIEFDDHEGFVSTVAYRPDGSQGLSVGADQTVRIWDMAERSSVRVHRGHTGNIWDVTALPDNRHYAIAMDGSNAGGPGSVFVRRYDSDEVVARLPRVNPDGNQFASIAVSPDGSRLIGAGSGGYVYIWDTGNWQAVGPPIAIPGGWDNRIVIDRVAVHPEATEIALVLRSDDSAAHSANSVVILPWDGRSMPDMASRRTITAGGVTPSEAVYHPDGGLLATAWSDNVVRIYRDGQWSRPERSLVGHGGPVWTVDYSPDGSMLITGSEDGTVGIWNAESGERLARFVNRGTTRSLRFAPDGQSFLSGTWVRDWRENRTVGYVRVWGGAAPADPDVAARITGLVPQEDRAGLQRVDPVKETDLINLYPETPPLWADPDPVLADYYRAIWPVRRALAAGSHNGLAGRVDRLQRWLDANLQHEHAAEAEALLLRATGTPEGE